MREIKFRSYIKGKMVSILCPMVGISINKVACFDNGYAEGYIVQWEDNPILMQYTGLKDKAGREIYEGDIVEMFACLHNIWEIRFGDYRVNIGDHWSSHTTAGFYAYSPLSNTTSKIDCNYNDGVLIGIIGNIYENPELLKG